MTPKHGPNRHAGPGQTSCTRLDIGAKDTTRTIDRELRMRARVNNVTDKKYWASVGVSPAFGYPVAAGPRSVVASRSVAF